MNPKPTSDLRVYGSTSSSTATSRVIVRQHVPLLGRRERSQPEDRLGLVGRRAAEGQRLRVLGLRDVADLLRAHVDAHREELAVDLGDDLVVAR